MGQHQDCSCQFLYGYRTDVAIEASDIILMGDNFSSIVNVIMWGRRVNNAVHKFLQFWISTNILAVVITFVTALASSAEGVLSAVQLLWIIMDTFGALALETDPASPALLNRKPDKKTDPLLLTPKARKTTHRLL